MQLNSESSEIKVNKSLLAQQIYDLLFDLLVKNELAPGTKLNIEGVSKQLGVSRSPVASAFSALERDGYLRILPQNGTFVREFTYEELDAIYMARAVLESIVVKFAVKCAPHEELIKYRERFSALRDNENLDDSHLTELFELDVELHQFLSEFVPDIIRKEYRNICNLTMRSRLLNLKHELQNSDCTKIVRMDAQIHLEIIEAIINKDETRSIQLLQHDVLNTKESVLKFLY